MNQQTPSPCICHGLLGGGAMFVAGHLSQCPLYTGPFHIIEQLASLRELQKIAPFQTHSETSLDAAIAIEPICSKLERAVLDFLAMRGDTGATDEELQAALGEGYGVSTIRPRRISLVHKKLVKDSQRKRPSKSGRGMTIWVTE